MNQQQWGPSTGGPPPAGPPHGGPPSTGPHGPGVPPSAPRRSGTAGWWVLIGLSVLVVVGLVLWAALGRGAGPGPTPSTPPPSPAQTTPPLSPSPSEMTSTEPSEPMDPGGDWGPFPPRNIDNLKDLTDPTFPAALGSFTLDSQGTTFGGADAAYIDGDSGESFLVSITFDTHTYLSVTQEMDDPEWVGDALCGTRTSGATGQEHLDCVMAGVAETLHVNNFRVPLDELGALTNELYQAL